MRKEALTKESAEIFPELFNFKGFYLVGGTALALQIGHRVSVDFDLFSQKELPPRLLTKIKRTFGKSAVSITYSAPEQLNVLLGGVKTTFFYYDYPVIDKLKSYKKVPIASIREIAAMKAFSIGKRLSYKDYIDWYFLLKEKHVTLSEVITHAKKKFGGDFNDRLFLGQLVYLDDITTQKIDFLRGAVNRESVQNFLREATREFMP